MPGGSPGGANAGCASTPSARSSARRPNGRRKPRDRSPARIARCPPVMPSHSRGAVWEGADLAAVGAAEHERRRSAGPRSRLRAAAGDGGGRAGRGCPARRAAVGPVLDVMRIDRAVPAAAGEAAAAVAAGERSAQRRRDAARLAPTLSDRPPRQTAARSPRRRRAAARSRPRAGCRRPARRGRRRAPRRARSPTAVAAGDCALDGDNCRQSDNRRVRHERVRAPTRRPPRAHLALKLRRRRVTREIQQLLLALDVLDARERAHLRMLRRPSANAA
jgi:hypothetical protein